MHGPSRSYGPPTTQYPLQDEVLRKRNAAVMETEEHLEYVLSTLTNK